MSLSYGNKKGKYAAEKGEKNKEKRRAMYGNFQTIIPRGFLEETNGYIKENKITKVELIQAGYAALNFYKMA